MSEEKLSVSFPLSSPRQRLSLHIWWVVGWNSRGHGENSHKIYKNCVKCVCEYRRNRQNPWKLCVCKSVCRCECICLCVCVLRGACVCLSCDAEQNKAPYLSSQQWAKRPDTRRNLFFFLFSQTVLWTVLSPTTHNVMKGHNLGDSVKVNMRCQIQAISEKHSSLRAGIGPLHGGVSVALL